MPATSRRGDFFNLRFADGFGALALKIGDEEIVTCIQHLTEMIISMYPRLHGGNLLAE